MKIFLSLLLAVCVLGCTVEDPARSTLQKSGHTNISTSTYSLLSPTQTKFISTNWLGMRVSGTVCCGGLKTCTIRY